MGVSVSVPTSQGSNTGAPSTGSSANAYLRLADIDDSTYVIYENGELTSQIGFGAPSPSIPAGAVVKSIAPLIRAGMASAGVGRLQSTLLSGDPVDTAVVASLVNSTTIQQFYPSSFTGAYDPTAIQLSLKQTVAGDLKVTTALLITTWVAQPVVNITAPTGTITEETAPTVTWENTLDADGGAQFGVNIRIWTDAVYGGGGFDPETSSYVDGEDFFGVETTWQGDASLEDGDYVVGVKITQSVSGLDSFAESDWDYQALTVDADRPAAPDFAVTADDAEARNVLILAANAGDATTDYFEVQRSDDGGVTFDWVRTSQETDGKIDNDGGEGGTLDYEAPNGISVIYRARSVHEYTNGVAASEWTEVTEDSWASTYVWIKHPTRPDLNFGNNSTLRSFPGHSRAARQSIKQPPNREDAVVLKAKRGPETGEITFRLSDDDSRDAIMELADAPCPLLLQFPPADHEYDRWIELGDESISRLVDHSWADERDGGYGWTRVARPTTGALVVLGLYPADALYPADDLFPE